MTEPIVRRLAAEFLGTFVLVFVGCGTAVLDAGNNGIDLLGVAIAFGIAVMVMVYAVGAVSGGHFNPAVTVGLAMARRFPWADVIAYVVTQVVAAVVAAVVLWAVASGQKGFSANDSGFASNGFGDHSPAHYNLGACLLVELILTAIFLYVIIGSTDVRAPAGFAGALAVLARTAGRRADRRRVLSIHHRRADGVAGPAAGDWLTGELSFPVA